MNKHLHYLWLILWGVCASGLMAGDFSDFQFKLLDTGKGHGESSFTGEGNNFELNVKNIDRSNYGVVIADFQTKVNATQELTFQLTGSPENQNAKLSLTLCYRENGKWFSKMIQGIPTGSGDTRELRFPLLKAFHFAPGEYELVQLKFGFGGGKQGAVSRLNVKNVRLQASTNTAATLAQNSKAETGFSDFNFELLDLGTGHGRASFSSLGESSFRLAIDNINSNNYAVVCANFQYSGFAQQRLVFRLKGAPANGDARLTVTLAHKNGEKWMSRDVAGIATRDEDFKTIVLGLDRDFQFGDARYEFVQLKFGFGGGPRDTTSHFEVSDVRIINAEELNVSGSSDPIIVPRLPRASALSSGTKIFFDFDNDDLRPIAQCHKNKPFAETVQPNSFAVQLLAGTEGIFRQVPTPAEADIIVSTRTVPGAQDQAIADAVASGKKLLIFGPASAKELQTLQPLSLKKRAQDGFPKREKLTVHTADPLTKLIPSERHFARYFDAALNPNARLLLSFADGTPFLAQKGNVLQFATGIANQSGISSAIFYDKGLLQILQQLAGRNQAQLDRREAEIIDRNNKANQGTIRDILTTAGLFPSEASRWQIGMSRENVGRFGWLIGESLLSSAISRDLGISNGSGVFRIFTGSGKSLVLPAWECKVLQGNVKLPDMEDVTAKWNGEGTVEYTASLPFDPAWKERQLFFEVRDGIDDIDELYLNGRKIGATDEKKPYYWMAPRRYAIPKDAIHFDKDNHLSLRVTNLRGEAGLNSKPLLSWADGNTHPPTLTVTAIDWTGKTYRLEEAGKAFELQFSLLSPFVRYHFPDAAELTFSQENLADFAAFSTDSGQKIISLDGKNEPLYDQNRDGKLTSPALLLFRNKLSRPFLLVFQHAPEAITPRYRGKLLEGFTIRWKNNAGELFAGWPFGLREINTSSWAKGIPAAMEHALRAATERALTYPVGCDELFSINRDKGIVEIINRFRFQKSNDDWNTPRREVATLPPLAGWMYKQNRLVSSPEKLEDLTIATNLGPTFGKAGSTIRYELPLPSGAEFIPVGVIDQELFPAGNRFFADGVRYSSGGGNPFAAWSPENPFGKEVPNQSICPFRWNFGLGTALQSFCTLTPENQNALRNRARIRHMEPLELYQYKYFVRHRQEPFSGLTYPVLINAFFPNETRYTPGFGSQVNYGDANEACILVGWVGQQLADLYGQSETIRANWPYYRYALKYQTTMDDYAFHAGSCRETGVGAWIDMLNGEFAGMLAYARLAELAGDAETSADCLYRAAKRMIPTLARLYPGKEAETALPELSGKSWQLTGFADDGPKPMYFPTDNGNFRGANDLFDFSQGTPGTLLALYFAEALSPVREHLDKRAWPSLAQGETCFNSFYYLPAFGLYRNNPEQTLDYARAVLKQNRLMHDWPDMMRPFQLGCVLWERYGKISFSQVRNVELLKAYFDPSTQILSIECSAFADSALVFRSEVPPRSILQNGKPITIRKTKNGYELPLVPGKQNFEISFPKFSNQEKTMK